MIPRSILFPTVSEITTPDKYTMQFKLSEPRPPNFIMSAFASGWNVIFRKKTLEDNNYNLRKVELYPGTGPFKSVRRVENEIWVIEKNKAYWNQGLPYLDGIEFYQPCPVLDRTRLRRSCRTASITPGSSIRSPSRKAAGDQQGCRVATFNQSVIHGDLGQHQESRWRSAGAPRDASRVRPAGA